ncbi:hypothetical protein IV102_08615 [bacterium]|nr:hypothetical protein [bacterium]
MTKPSKPAELEKQVRHLLELSGPAGREGWQQVAQHFGFPGLTWLWGPPLYRLDPIGFRPLLLARFSWQTWAGGWRWQPTPWSPRLEEWLTAVEAAEDVELSQRLLSWKLLAQVSFSFSKLPPKFNQELLRRWQAIASPAQRRLELRKLDLWCPLTEDTALVLFQADPEAAAPYILRHLPRVSKAFWTRLYQAALAQQEDFAWKLYRALVPASQWEADILKACSPLTATSSLHKELQKRTPEHVYGNALAGGLLKILEARGEEAFSYVIPQLKRIWKPLFGRGNYGKIMALAEQRGWTELWAAVVRICAPLKEYNQILRAVLQSPAQRQEKLLGLSGVSKQWDFSGLGLAQVQTLEAASVLALYQFDPAWLRGPFKLHLQIHPSTPGYLAVLEKLIEAGEDELVDLLASRFLTFHKAGPEVERLFAYYSQLQEGGRFARRAANALGKLPSFALWNYNQLMRSNRLARLFFERSAQDYAQDPQALADLVEASEIHAMALGYRCLSLASPQQALQHLTLLKGCLFRPLQRDTRQWALRALARASQAGLEEARSILGSAREAQRMPDLRYPKEALLALIADILDRWPALRGPREQPRIYRREVSRV